MKPGECSKGGTVLVVFCSVLLFLSSFVFLHLYLCYPFWRNKDGDGYDDEDDVDTPDDEKF